MSYRRWCTVKKRRKKKRPKQKMLHDYNKCGIFFARGPNKWCVCFVFAFSHNKFGEHTVCLVGCASVNAYPLANRPPESEIASKRSALSNFSSAPVSAWRREGGAQSRGSHTQERRCCCCCTVSVFVLLKSRRGWMQSEPSAARIQGPITPLPVQGGTTESDIVLLCPR